MRDLTPFEQALLRQLRIKDSTNAKNILKRTSCQFVLEYGWFYEPASVPKAVKMASEGECYNNALILALTDPSLIYVEGFTASEGGVRIHHAWVTDGRGRAIDITWAAQGAVYIGVPFKSGFVSLMGLKNKGVGSPLDDWENGYPLLRELGDRPEEWLEPRGNGFAKVT
jgi:hypothetical protein